VWGDWVGGVLRSTCRAQDHWQASCLKCHGFISVST
jgi:hypothetical protein